MPEIPTTEDLENAKKFPWQMAVIILMGVIGAVFGFYQLRVNKSDETCDQRVTNLMHVNTKKDSIIADWQSRYLILSNELLYKNNIIDRTDSITRKKLEKPAKQIIKANE